MEMSNKRACVVVLGDIGRSPRMQYHALSLTKEGYKVDLVGYGGSSPHSDLIFNQNVTLHFMKQSPDFASVFPRSISYFLKVFWQSLFLVLKLFFIAKPGFILVQNPPSIPTLPVCWFIAKLRGAQLIVDWHNYGYSILALSLGKLHKLVRFSHFLEHFFGRLANYNFCVTQAMCDDLKKNWGVR